MEAPSFPGNLPLLLSSLKTTNGERGPSVPQALSLSLLARLMGLLVLFFGSEFAPASQPASLNPVLFQQLRQTDNLALQRKQLLGGFLFSLLRHVDQAAHLLLDGLVARQLGLSGGQFLRQGLDDLGLGLDDLLLVLKEPLEGAGVCAWRGGGGGARLSGSVVLFGLLLFFILFCGQPVLYEIYQSNSGTY